jgi:D-3-phosphoglycerate dehydrogenase / 2-oxoglutarate reductase
VAERVVVADPLSANGLQLLRGVPALEVVETVGKGADALHDALVDAAALIVRSETKVTADLMARGPKLRVIARAGIGTDNIDLDEATKRGIPVLTAPGANSTSAAEHAFALLLGMLRKVPAASALMAAGKWDRKAFQGTELRGKTLGILGLGRIGTHVARIAQGFGMTVVALDPYVVASHALSLGVELLPLEQVLARADIVTLHLALTDETRHLLNAARIAQMKKGAYLVNTARGGLIEDAALVAALEAGQLAGAALDVFDPEPLPADSPLRKAPNVILTPHLGASTKEAQTRVALEIAEAVRDALLKGDLRSAVNLSGLDGAHIAASKPLIELGERLGRLAFVLGSGGVKAIDVCYFGSDDRAADTAGIAALKGVLGAMGIERVSLVNAAHLARQRGIRVTRRAADPDVYEESLQVDLVADGRSVGVRGALLGENHQRIVRIGEHRVDIEPTGALLVLTNRDVPGVVGKVGTILGNAGVNISDYHQSRPPRPGEDALAAIAVDVRVPQPVVDELRRLAETTGVFQVDLGVAG